jgi:hypothetical protein
MRELHNMLQMQLNNEEFAHTSHLLRLNCHNKWVVGPTTP